MTWGSTVCVCVSSVCERVGMCVRRKSECETDFMHNALHGLTNKLANQQLSIFLNASANAGAKAPA